MAKGKTLWEDELECSSCHEVESGASSDGPTLFDHGSTAWVERVIRDSSAPDLFGEEASMPKFADKLTDSEILSLAHYITTHSYNSIHDIVLVFGPAWRLLRLVCRMS